MAEKGGLVGLNYCAGFLDDQPSPCCLLYTSGVAAQIASGGIEGHQTVKDLAVQRDAPGRPVAEMCIRDRGHSATPCHPTTP